MRNCRNSGAVTWRRRIRGTPSSSTAAADSSQAGMATYQLTAVPRVNTVRPAASAAIQTPVPAPQYASAQTTAIVNKSPLIHMSSTPCA